MGAAMFYNVAAWEARKMRVLFEGGKRMAMARTGDKGLSWKGRDDL